MKKLILFLMIFVSITVNAQTYYISPIGNDAANGSQATPWKTLSKASTVTTPGSVIRVTAGTYTSTQTVNLAAGVSIEGEGKATTILKSSVTGQWIPFIQMESPNSTNGNQSISNVTIDGNTNTTGNESGTWVGVWITGRSNVSIHDCIIKNFYAYGSIFQGNNLDGVTAKNWTSGPYATGNKFYNNESTNCAGIIPSIQGGSGALGIGWQDGMLIHHNNITTTQRPVSKNGWPIKFISNGYLKGVKIYDNVLKKSPFQGYQPYSPPDWDFCIEFFNVQGLELYNNYIQGSVDVNYIYKGSYQYGLWAHHNTFDNPGNFNHWEGGFILEFKADHVLIENNIINNRSLGVTYNTRGISNNGGENNYACNYGGSIGGCSGIINNVIRNNVFSNLYQAGGVPGGIVTITEGTDDVQIDGLYIYNNVFSGKSSGATYNGLDFGGIGSGASVKNVYIRNNIFQNFQSNPIVKQSGGSQSNIQITNNDFYNNGDNTISWTGATLSNNQTINPLFVSATDFHLQATSPLINAGFTPLLLPAYAQAVPFSGSAPDLGAFETGGLPPVLCTYFVYSAWSTCSASGTQTRTYTSLPVGCTGTPPPDSLTRTCTPPPVSCTYTYSAWSTCVNGTQTRTVTGTSPAGCVQTPPPILTQSCIPPTCTYTYSAWSTCVNGQQTRTVVSSTPSGCTGTPILTQSCTSPIPGDTIYCTQVQYALPTSNTVRVKRNITYIIKKADGWYDNSGLKIEPILYQINNKWYLL